MKTSTLIVAVASAATLLLLAVPKKGAVASTDAAAFAPAPLVPKPLASKSSDDGQPSERLSAQLLRVSTLDWKRDPFAPLFLARDVEPVPVPPVEEPAEEPVEEPVEPEPLPDTPQPPARTGPLPVLSGISQSGAHRFAIVDRIIVEEGHVLPSGDEVMSIGHRTVTLRNGEEIVVIRLGDGR